MSAFFGFSGYVERITEPSGMITNFTWGRSDWCIHWDWECYGFVPVWRIQRIENNLGYGIAFDYEGSDALEDYGLYIRKKRVVSYNASIERCGPDNNFCRTSPNKWSSADYGYSVGAGYPTSVTDQSGRTTTYTYSGANLASIRLPGSSSDDVSISYTSGRVSSVTDGTGTWNYTYSDIGTTRTTTTTGPLAQSLIAVSNLTIGRATSVTEKVSTTPAVSRTTTYTYDAQRRLKRVTQPEGDYGELTYDARGNVTQVLHAPKPGSGLTNNHHLSDLSRDLRQSRHLQPAGLDDGRARKHHQLHL